MEGEDSRRHIGLASPDQVASTIVEASDRIILCASKVQQPPVLLALIPVTGVLYVYIKHAGLGVTEFIGSAFWVLRCMSVHCAE